MTLPLFATLTAAAVAAGILNAKIIRLKVAGKRVPALLSVERYLCFGGVGMLSLLLAENFAR